MSMFNMRGLGVVAVAVLAPLAGAQAQVIWDEANQGDLSDDRLAPTSLLLGAGDNRLLGVLEGTDTEGNPDRDYYSITIPAGFALSQIVLESYVSEDGGAFSAIESGATFPLSPDDATPANLMGWVIFGVATPNQDLLPTMDANGMGFDIPLGAGTYTFWTQQTGSATTYTWNFVVVPAPATAGVFGLGLLAAARRRR